MHASAAFLERRIDRLLALARRHPLALVIAVEQGAPWVAHAPVLAEGDGAGGAFLHFHLSRASRAGRAIQAAGRALVVFTGPQAYVSPDWYGVPDQVPTWNYLSVEAEGPASTLDPDEATRLLDALSARFETQLAPKAPWTRGKMTPGRFESMLSGIVAFRLEPERFEGTAKLSQNRDAAARRGVARALGPAHPLARWMQEPDG